MKNTILISFLLSLIFGLGLGISGMTNPQNVLGFLDIFGNPKPALILVMGFGILIATPIFMYAKTKAKPVLQDDFPNLPNKIDFNLIFGAIIFGIGWGIAGLCPGPSIVILPKFPIEIIIFIASMVMGSFAAKFIHRK